MRTDSLTRESVNHIKINQYDNMYVTDSRVSESKKSYGPIKWFKMTAWMLALFFNRDNIKKKIICNGFCRFRNRQSKKTFHFELDVGYETVGILNFFSRNRKPTFMAFICTTL